MTRTPVALTLRLWELLADGEWHDARQVRAILAADIPDGEAIRFNETVRAHNSSDAPPSRIYAISRADAARSGRRAITQRVINGARRVGRVETDPVKTTRQMWEDEKQAIRIRWRPDAPPLGVYSDPIDSHGRRLRTIAADHHPVGESGLCAECGHPWQCRTYQLAAGANHGEEEAGHPEPTVEQ